MVKEHGRLDMDGAAEVDARQARAAVDHCRNAVAYPRGDQAEVVDLQGFEAGTKGAWRVETKIKKLFSERPTPFASPRYTNTMTKHAGLTDGEHRAEWDDFHHIVCDHSEVAHAAQLGRQQMFPAFLLKGGWGGVVLGEEG